MSTEQSTPSLPHSSERRPAMWPWLLMPLAALTLYFALHSVRESAPPQPDSPVQTAPPAQGSDSSP